ncbi:pyrimidine dimer DNA glycosylase/endonuclease V [Agrococcus sp. ARC_14]|uniref:pyrimidine dimer DNA glycosylase/endonuclease V n=1 Tax=Agrococcus sp. ARC_14 TaxID=2919927 RepID=UPI001F059013|nr:pyrimidine dimer DNA glycosylase/endonuclease V [Agrococcus sp. ARC_14]MCH1881726.1 pyrimidine dimer DNA glycosylase/endonuclease V [Agrococcus sp. ARC_14]
MRLWSLHPGLLDRQGLTACWREALLAQAVLAGRTRGYTRHPQLERFRAQPDPLAAIGAYLEVVATAAEARGYRFDRGRIERTRLDGSEPVRRIPVSDGQLALELEHLRAKLAVRSPSARLPRDPEPHPLFIVAPGPVADWERHTPTAETESEHHHAP